MSGNMISGDILVGNDNDVMGTMASEVIWGTILNDTIIGGLGDDEIHGDADDVLKTTGTIETFEDTSSGRGYATTDAAWLGDWYAPDGHSVLDASAYGLSDDGHGQTLELASDQNTSITRTFDDLTTGQEISFGFDIALPEHQRTPGSDGVRVIWNGEIIGDFSVDQHNVWETINLNLVAGSGDGSNTLTLEGIGESDWWGALIDNLHFVVPQEAEGGNDYLVGGEGNDVIYGGAGRDWLEGGTGEDNLVGGDGVDTATYANAASAVTVHLGKGVGTRGEAKGDTYTSIENAHGSDFNDVIKGDSNSNRLVGRDGNDNLQGGGGNDYLLGGRGADKLNGGSGTDTAEYDWSTSGVDVNLTTGLGSGGFAEGDTLKKIENVQGSRHDDVLTGNSGVNRLQGAEGDDVLNGMSGNDILIGGLGADTLIGGEGARDAAEYQDATEAVGVDLINGGFGGEANGDTFDGVEFVYGSAFNDAISGDDGINRLVGRDGDDALNGAGGNDYIIGGAGNDSLFGGEGADVFLYKGDVFNDDVIFDFEYGLGRTDRIWLDGFDGIGFDNISITDTDEGAVIEVENYGSITLYGVDTVDLVEDDFIF